MRRLLFRLASAVHVFVYRLSGGKIAGEIRGFRLLLLTTTGRKSGKMRTIPLGYFEHDGGYITIGSNAGSASHPAWFRNLRNHPQATIQVKDRRLEVRAETAEGDERGRLWARLMEVAPGYANYAKRTNRQIPLVILRPV